MLVIFVHRHCVLKDVACLYIMLESTTDVCSLDSHHCIVSLQIRQKRLMHKQPDILNTSKNTFTLKTVIDTQQLNN